jgi:hypothetical protein
MRSALAVVTVLAAWSCIPPVPTDFVGSSPETIADTSEPSDERDERAPAAVPTECADERAPAAVPTECAATMDWEPFAFVGPVVDVPAGADLQAAIDAAPDGAVLALAPGRYVAKPNPYVDPTCGNCQLGDPKTPKATVGFVLRGKSIAIRGAGAGRTEIVTGAGYGVYIEDACEVRLEGLSITGGKRDPDGNAADGGVVVRRSRATLAGVAITKNAELMPGGRYPGIAGVMCREGSDVLVTGSEIADNSWDGVAVYRDGQVRVVGTHIARGNGVAVGVTWNGRAHVVASDLESYWKGVGAFQDAKVELYATFVHENLGWGVWAADRGEIIAVNNTIAFNDLLGAHLGSATSRGVFVNNVVVFNGKNEKGAYTPQTFGRGGIRGFAPKSSPFTIAYNVLYANVGGDYVQASGSGTVPTSEWGATNRRVDPKLVSREDLTPRPGSPLLGTGDPAIQNPDGSRSHVGATGGPHAAATATAPGD